MPDIDTTLQKKLAKLKWATLQRLQYIEITAFYCGQVSRTDVAKAFAISDAAATKDLALYGQLAPDNLIYRQSHFGYVPGPNFRERLADLSPEKVLPMLAQNQSSIGGPYGNQRIYSIPTAELPIPCRLPDRAITAQVLRAIAQGKKLAVHYLSLSDRDSEAKRIIEPHALCHNGLRWHIRAYNEETFDFRDFVLSRIATAEMLDVNAESGSEFDEDWVESVILQLIPHPGLVEKKRMALLMDFAAEDGVITIEVRRALLGYLLQRLRVDTSPEHSLNPSAYQLVVANRDEIEPFAEWAFKI